MKIYRRRYRKAGYMKIAIIDDMTSDRELILDLTQQYLEKNNIHVAIETFDSGESFFDVYHQGDFSIVLSDMMMTGMDGLSVAKKLRQHSDSCQIVFITIDASYAVSGYDVEAAGYVLKPADLPSLERVLDRCFNRLKQAPKYIEVVIDRITSKISLNSIIWINTYRNTIQFHTDGGILKSYMTFQSLLGLLKDDERFLTCYKGCIVNMDRISCVEADDFRMDNGDLVQIRKRGAQHIKQAYVQYTCAQSERTT